MTYFNELGLGPIPLGGGDGVDYLLKVFAILFELVLPPNRPPW